MWPSHGAMWRVIEIGDEYVVSMVTNPAVKGRDPLPALCV